MITKEDLTKFYEAASNMSDAAYAYGNQAIHSVGFKRRSKKSIDD